MSSESFIAWLYATPLSTGIRNLLWVVPTVQSVHIIAIAVAFGAAFISDLRLAGVLATDESRAKVVRRYAPWMRYAFVVLLLTGLVMTIGEPDRVLVNSTFWLKMGLIVGLFTLTWWLRRPLLRPAGLAASHDQATASRLLPWVSIALWCVVIFCGRWIAYTI